MRILFAVTHLGFLRNFESTLALLAEHGHQIHLVTDRASKAGVTDGTPIVERLAGEVGLTGFTVDPSNGDILVVDRGAGGFGGAGTGSIKRITVGADDSSFPATLTKTGFFADLGDLTPQPGAVAYNPNLRFWSDFAEKTRWSLIKNATDTMGYSKDGVWTFPTGMIWAKHFDMPTEWETFTRTINGANVIDRRPKANCRAGAHCRNPLGEDQNSVARFDRRHP
jgi:hypothetical protein